MGNYLISIGIPTRNRQYYAKNVTRQIYAISDNIQIVISDNSTDESLREELNDIIDGERVIYIYEPEKISVVQNYDKTARHSDGKYYFAIGDDDLILPNILDLAEWMERNHVDAVRTSRKLNYRWPSQDKKNGRLLTGPFFAEYHEFNAFDGVINILNNGCQGYLHTDMAGSYHALVSMKSMKAVYEKTGFYFNGFSPDIYSATCLSLLTDIHCAYMDYPVSLPGWCPFSASYRAWKNSAVSSVEDAIKNYSSEGYEWEKLVPYYYAPETTWADTVLKAIKDMGRLDLIEQYFNREALIKALYCNRPYNREDIMKQLNDEEKELLFKKGSFFNSNFPEENQSKWKVIGDMILRGQRRYYFVNDNFSAIRHMKHFLSKKSEREKWDKLMCREVLR